MKKVLKIIALFAIAAFAAIQFYRPNTLTAPIVRAETLEASAEMPEDIALILKRSCNDCHTNQTNYPWYAAVTPVNWLLADHIDEGRKEMNFSVWNTYSAKKKQRKFDEICDQVVSGEMPHYQYIWMHGDAKLSDDDQKALCDWARTEKSKVSDDQ